MNRLHKRKNKPGADVRQPAMSSCSIPSRETLLEVLSTTDKKVHPSEFIKSLKLEASAIDPTIKRLKAMIRDGQLIQNKKGLIKVCKGMTLIKARALVKRNAVELQIIDSPKPNLLNNQLLLTERHCRGIMNDDILTVRCSPTDRHGQQKAVLVSIEKRGQTHLHGVIQRSPHETSLNVSRKQYYGQIHLIKNSILQQCQDGDYVSCRITQYPTRHTPIEVTIETIMGDHSKARLERLLTVNQYQLPDIFSPAVLNEANEQTTKDFHQDSNRLDWTNFNFITIDGEDSKDFDDAIHVEKLETGWIARIAIADVSYYVKPESLLDKEAVNRATSVYLPGSTLPMLPEILSNDLCSLVPNQNRPVLGVEIHLSKQGKTQNYSFHKAIIHSKARLTYREATEILNQANSDNQVHQVVNYAKDLFLRLHKIRNKRGALAIELGQTKAVFNQNGRIESFRTEERTIAHKIIEELMLIANECAALWLDSNKLKGVYRNHLKPDSEKFDRIKPFLTHCGIQTAIKHQSSKSWQQLLIELSKHTNYRHLAPMVLSCMSQANYGQQSKGHFGLAYKYYTHFTSPIRRYPDLWVHRVISDHLEDPQGKHNQSELNESLAKHCSFAERRADEASRYAMDWLKCDFIKVYEGHSFQGTIVAIKSFGFFVSINQLNIEGLVPLRSMSHDFYHFNETLQQLEGQYEGKIYQLGDQVMITVANVDIIENQIDLTLVTD